MASSIGRCVAGGAIALLALIASGFQAPPSPPPGGPPPVRAHLPRGVPVAIPAPAGQHVSHDLFALQSNPQTKFPSWVAYLATDYDHDGTSNKPAPNWKPDPLVNPDAMLEEADFNGSNYQKVGLVDRTLLNVSDHIDDADLFSHVVPMTPDAYVAWQQLEQVTRQIMGDYARVWIITGPYYETGEMTELPNADEDHRVPNGYWKVIVGERRRGIHINAFKIAQNVASGTDWHDCIADLDDLQVRIATSLLPEAIAGEIIDPRLPGPVSRHAPCRRCLVKMPRKPGKPTFPALPVPKSNCKYLLDCLFCENGGIWQKVSSLAVEEPPDE